MASDLHSFAWPDEARVVHLKLELEVDFTRRVLRGKAALDLVVADKVTQAVFDTRGLRILEITDGKGNDLPYLLGDPDPLLGTALTVSLWGDARRVVITYETGPDAPALDWLEPYQTAGGVHPYLFTQGHAIQTRSWIPIQDSPAIRFTYEAKIIAPAPLVVLMSAESKGQTELDRGRRMFQFQMKESVPAYLVAMTVGELLRHEIGPRTAVFAEPTLLARAAHEFSELESILYAAEALLGPYRWGRFDVVVMPPSFPYGGMENPRLTFASPTLLAGDRSLVTVVAHELAHAWAGNLVTNATWNDFWLNEGTTVYVELRLFEVLWGAPKAELLKTWGYRELAREVQSMGERSPDTRLAYDMFGRDPAEGVTVIPYLKGAAFFWALEREVGRDRLDLWLRGWFRRHTFQSVTTEQLLDDLHVHLREGSDAASPFRMDLERWVHDPGLAPDAEPPRSALLDRIDQMIQAVFAGTPPSELDVSEFSPQAWRHFLGGLLLGKPSAELVRELNQQFHFSASRNAEVQLPWLRLLLSVGFEHARPELELFLRSQGRMKFLRPLYADLRTTPEGAAFAATLYGQMRPRYHALVRRGLDKLFSTPSVPAAAPPG